MNYFTTTLLRSLISNDNNLPAFEQVVSELFRSELENAIEDTFPMAKIQRCQVHVSKNIIAKVRVKDRSEISQDFKRVYNCETEKAASEELNEFISKRGKKYPKVAKSL